MEKSRYPMMAEAHRFPFVIGVRYNRRHDIHDRFGGSRQSGIVSAPKHNAIFIFTGDAGHQHGYRDHWDGPVFYYTGEGQKGDMTFVRGNRAIRDHVSEGRSLLAFKSHGKASAYEYLGEFVCQTYERRLMPDREGAMRDGIIFHLVSVEAAKSFVDAAVQERPSSISRAAAYYAAGASSQADAKIGVRRYYERSLAVKAYVLDRARGHCECCGAPAPFTRKDGRPYLEPHHIRQLSDQGLDRPDFVAAITPNCHREIHYGENGAEKNRSLAEAIQKKERALDADRASTDRAA